MGDAPQDEEENAAQGQFPAGTIPTKLAKTCKFDPRSTVDSNRCMAKCIDLHMFHTKLVGNVVTYVSAAAAFDEASALSNGEASAMLSKIVDKKKADDPAYQPNPLLAKTLEYAERFSGNKTEAVNQQVRQ